MRDPDGRCAGGALAGGAGAGGGGGQVLYPVSELARATRGEEGVEDKRTSADVTPRAASYWGRLPGLG